MSHVLNFLHCQNLKPHDDNDSKFDAFAEVLTVFDLIQGSRIDFKSEGAKIVLY